MPDMEKVKQAVDEAIDYLDEAIDQAHDEFMQYTVDHFDDEDALEQMEKRSEIIKLLSSSLNALMEAYDKLNAKE